jgi:hypothetical protein
VVSTWRRKGSLAATPSSPLDEVEEDLGHMENACWVAELHDGTHRDECLALEPRVIGWICDTR